jgi:hypothetical protein
MLAGSSQVTHCTDNRNHPSGVRLLISLLAATAIMACAFGPLASTARADGDPASDVLASQSLFLPQDAGIPLAQQKQLAGLLAAADRSGYQIRVAVIASSADLGSVTVLWRQPETYARFLDQELSLIYTGPLLVVMPNGFGFASISPPPSGAERAALAGVRAGGGGAGLGAVALAAIERLAAASGHAVPIPPATATPSASGSSGDTIALIVFVAGAALVALAWAASLRARPPRLPGRRAASR